MSEENRRCPLERVTVYWCNAVLGGIHYDSDQGTWNGERKRPEEYVRADIVAAERVRLATDSGIKSDLLEEIANGTLAPTREAIQARHDAMWVEARAGARQPA